MVTTGPKDITKSDTPGVDLKGVHDGYHFLEEVFMNGVESYLKNPKYDLGKEIIVVGGGDTALDDSRTAKRLSKGNVTVVYRRTENEMHSDPIMVEEGEGGRNRVQVLGRSEIIRGQRWKTRFCRNEYDEAR